MEYLFTLLQPAQSWLFETLVLPTLFQFGFMSYADDADDATGVFMLGMAEVALIYLIARPLESWKPVEPWRDRRGVRVDVLYTLLYRSGLAVGPRYHRIHHGIGVGREGKTQGCNFATPFPVWDMLFGTANFARDYPATGIRDQLEGVDYDVGFVSQQVKAPVRLWRSPARAPAPAA